MSWPEEVASSSPRKSTAISDEVPKRHLRMIAQRFGTKALRSDSPPGDDQSL